MDIDVFPDLTAPTVVIMTDCQGMASEEVERLVTFPIETAVNGATNVRRVRSTSGYGTSFVWVEFDWGMDVFRARQIISEKMVAITEELPDGITPQMAPQSSVMGEILFIGLQTDSTRVKPDRRPTSMMELRSLAEVIKSHEDLFILADEIYEHINYVGKHESIAQFDGMKERTIIVNGVSKAYAMTGWRIGYIAAPEWIVKGCNKLQGQYTSGPCSVSQKAAEAAYIGNQQCVEEMRKAFERRRDLIVKLAKEIPGLEVNTPQGAFYLFPKCSSFIGKSYNGKTIENTNDLALFLLEEAHVATVGGDAFGDPDCFRMSYATSDENICEAMSRIKHALSLLK